MTRLFFALLTLFFLNSPAMGENSNFRRCILAAKGLNSPAALMGVERASPELLANMSAHGRSVNFALEGTDELRYLNSIPAEANVGGVGHTHILLRENPSKAAALEEFLHGTQDRLGIIDRLGNQGAEIHVKEFMLRHQQLLGIGAEDADILQKLLELEHR